MDLPWRLQILGGPKDGQVRTMSPGTLYWREPDAVPQADWTATDSEPTSAVITYTAYLVVKDKRSGRRYLAHPDLRLP